MKTKKRPQKKRSRYKLTNRVKLTPDQHARAQKETGKAEAAMYEPKGGDYVKTLRSIRGIGKAYKKAKKYVLYTNQLGRTLYAGDNDILKLPTVNELDEPIPCVPVTFNIYEALKFAMGFDIAERKIEHWNKITGLKFLTRLI